MERVAFAFDRMEKKATGGKQLTLPRFSRRLLLDFFLLLRQMRLHLLILSQFLHHRRRTGQIHLTR